MHDDSTRSMHTGFSTIRSADPYSTSRAGPWSLFDRLSRFYDLQLRLERRAIEAALEMLSPRADDRLLDLGTGTGGVLRAVAERAERPREMIGLDRSRRMLAQVPHDLPPHRLVEADATRIPFGDAHFSAVTSVYLLHLLEPRDAERTVAEVRRVTCGGGRVVVVVPTLPSGVVARPYRALVGALAVVGPTSLGLRPLDPRGLLERNGLSVRRARYVRDGYPSLCVLARA